MSNHPSPREVAEVPLFCGLTPEEHARIAALAEIETFSAGSTLFVEGDPPGDLYILLEGRVTLCMRVAGRPDTCFLSLHQSELVGWSSLLVRPRVATARVVQPSRLLRLRTSEMLELCETDHHVGYAIMKQAFEEMAERLQTTRLQLLDMFGTKSGS
jgi:CRP-like cAMP-binding protein